MPLHDFKALTFDCYGTLIDWETGLLHARSRRCGGRGDSRRGRDEVLAAVRHATRSRSRRQTPAMLYPQLLAQVHRRLARDWGVTVSEAAHTRLRQLGAGVAGVCRHAGGACST